MNVFKQIDSIQQEVKILKTQSKSIGFVPTMGALHKGHASLIKAAVELCDICIVSIFVNPTQFNNHEDLVNYPKTEKKDLQLLEEIGCTIAFIPSAETIYPNGQISESWNFKGLENLMEGKHRSGHFAGVATVVNRLFDIIKPNKAFFGEKDFQQLLIIKNLVKQKHLNIKIVGVPIVREKDGLAMSSRNLRLTQEFRNSSPLIYQTLKEVKALFETKSIEFIKKMVNHTFKNSPLKLEYFEIVDENTLQSAKIKNPENNYRAFIAAYAGEIRLIDNISL